MRSYYLSNGIAIPKIGFGTWQIPDGKEAYNAVLCALELGYRHIDTAQIYGNESSVGRVMRDSKIAREDIFLTTKVWNDKVGYEDTLASVEESLEKLQVDYLDLVLIHWPNPKSIRGSIDWKERNHQVWKALEELYRSGKVRAIGVSNFMKHHLDALLESADIVPQVNQIMLAPGTPQTELVNYCKDKGILLEAYSPFCTGTLFQSDVAKSLAESEGMSLAQLALAWSLNKGFLPLPKSTSPDNIKNNLASVNLLIDQEVVAQLDQLEGIKSQLNPDQAEF